MTRFAAVFLALGALGCNNAANSAAEYDASRVEKICTWHTDLGCTTTYASHADCADSLAINSETDCGDGYSLVFDKDLAEACLDEYDTYLADAGSECQTTPPVVSTDCAYVSTCEPDA